MDSANLYQTLTERSSRSSTTGCERHSAPMDSTHPPRDGHAGAAVHHRPHGQGIHAEVLPDEVKSSPAAANHGRRTESARPSSTNRRTMWTTMS